MAIAVDADGTGSSGAVVDGVAEEEEARDLFFLRSASGSSMKLFSKSKPRMHYPVFISSKRERKQAELAYINYSYHDMHVIIVHVMLDLVIHCPPR